MNVSFTQHPQAVGETYGEHFAVASSFGIAMLIGGLACLVHAVLPFLCTSTGSGTIRRLHERMVTNRIRAGSPQVAQPQVAQPQVSQPQVAQQQVAQMGA